MTLTELRYIVAVARALAATLAGADTAVVYPAMPVVVKTPARQARTRTGW